LKIIFLDFDGPLVPFSAPDKKRRPAKVSPRAMSMLNLLGSETEAKIVVTSDWREKVPIEKLAKCLKDWGCELEVIDKTPVLGQRGDEIFAWLDSREDVESFVVIDDTLPGLLTFAGQNLLVLVDPMVALTRRDADLARMILERSRDC
jgi:hypothetical protein